MAPYAIPQLLLGLNDTLNKLALADLHHNLQDLLDIIKTFVGSLPNAAFAARAGDAGHAETL